jgi:hypothetical protein
MPILMKMWLMIRIDKGCCSPSVKIIMMIMKITLKWDCVLTSMRRSKVKNADNKNIEDVVVMWMVKIKILTEIK